MRVIFHVFILLKQFFFSVAHENSLENVESVGKTIVKSIC